MKLGIYKHNKKGNLYEVIAVATHSENEEQFVVYKCCQSGRVWIRPLDMFKEEVEINGVKKPRFEIVDD